MKKIIVALVMVGLALFLAGCSGTEQTYDASVKPPPPPAATETAKATESVASPAEPRGNHLEKGISYAKAGNFYFAIREYEKAQKDNPKDPLPHYYSAVAYSMLERTSRKSEAYREFKAALALGLKGEFAASAGKWMSEAEKQDLAAEKRIASGQPVGVAPTTAVSAEPSAPVGAAFAFEAGEMVAALDKVKGAIDSGFTYEAFAALVKTLGKDLEEFNAKYGEAPEKDSAAFRLILEASDNYIKSAAMWKNQLATGSVDENTLNVKWRAAAKALDEAHKTLKK